MPDMPPLASDRVEWRLRLSGAEGPLADPLANLDPEVLAGDPPRPLAALVRALIAALTPLPLRPHTSEKPFPEPRDAGANRQDHPLRIVHP